jgi:hypothetical protein
MKTILSLVLVFASSVAFSMDASIIGKWDTTVASDEVSYNVYLDIFENTSKIGVTCTAGGQSGTAEVTVASKIEGNVYNVLGTEAQTTKVGEVDCTVNVKPMAFTYEVTETQLRLNTEDGQVIFLNRVR